MFSLSIQNRRQSPRVSITKKMNLICRGQRFEANLLNVSKSGAGFIVKKNSVFLIDINTTIVMQCNIDSEVIDISLSVKHFREMSSGILFGASIINEAQLKHDIMYYVENHSVEKHESLSNTSKERAESASLYLEKIHPIVFNSMGVGDLGNNIQGSGKRLYDDHFVSTISLSSNIISTFIDVEYTVEDLSKLYKHRFDVVEKYHDYIREKLNVTVGGLKKWIISRSNTEESECENFRVTIPSTYVTSNAVVTECDFDGKIRWHVGRSNEEKVYLTIKAIISDAKKCKNILRKIQDEKVSEKFHDIEFL